MVLSGTTTRTFLSLVGSNGMRPARALLQVLLLGMCMGNDCFPTGTGDGGTPSTGYVGLGAPALELTIDGTHVGPSPATAGAYADLTSFADGLGRRQSTDLFIHATGGIATCDIHVSRFGTNIGPFSALAYRLVTPSSGVTADGTASPVGKVSVTAGGLTLQCNGTDCNGLLNINVLDAAHIEGYLTGTLADPSDGQASSVVCTFYVPWRTYQP